MKTQSHALLLLLVLALSGTTGCATLGSALKQKFQSNDAKELSEKVNRASASMQVAQTKKDAASWEDAAEAAYHLDREMLSTSERRPLDEDQTAALDLARQNIKALYAMELPGSELDPVRRRFLTSMAIQFDPELTKIADVESSIPKFSKLMGDYFEKEGGIAAYVKTQEEGTCVLNEPTTSPSPTAATADLGLGGDDGDDDSAEDTHHERAAKVPTTGKANGSQGKGEKKKRKKTISTRGSERERERDRDRDRDREDSAKPEVSAPTQSPSSTPPTAAVAPPSKPLFHAEASSGKMIARCYFPKMLRGYARSTGDTIVVRAVLDEERTHVRAEGANSIEVSPPSNLNITDYAFEIPLATIAKMFQKQADHQKGDWGRVEIAYVASVKAGQRMERNGTGIDVRDKWERNTLASGTFALKWRTSK